MADAHAIHAPHVSAQAVLSKTDYFVDVQLWPLLEDLGPERWLSNFLAGEREYAVQLLSSFLYFSSKLMNQMFISAFQSLSTSFYSPADSFLNFQSKWRAFVDSVVITYVTGETPNPTDSGYAFARRARKLLGIDESRIMTPDEAVRQLMQQAGPVVFVDDFVGSGNQFLKTWTRPVSVAGVTSSFSRISAVQGADFYYCPLLCTEYGYTRLTSTCPAVRVEPAHVLSPRYSALEPNSLIWPAHLQNTAVDFLKRASERAGIPDTDGNVDDWRGFHKLGLAVALGDSVPDATLPIFYWERNGWIPLIHRT